jgi:hypothetical protein
MVEDFEIYEPKKFYAEFVRRAYDEFVASPLDLYRVKVAVIQADTMAERVWNFYKDNPGKIGGARTARAYRQFIVAKECPDFQLVWDVHDGHKHVSLRREGRKVTSAAQTGIRKIEGAFASDAFSEAFQIERTDAVINLDDGTERIFSDVLRSVVEMWERLLSKF